MKKLGILLLLLCLLPGSAWAELKIEPDRALPAYTLGETLEVAVTGAKADTCRYTLKRGGKTVFEGQDTAVFGGILHPRQMGKYTLLVQSGMEEAAFDFTVTDAPVQTENAGEKQASGGLLIACSRSTVMQQGDVRLVTVHSDGPWTARIEDDFVLLSKDCGMDGESLYITILPTEEARQGQVTFACGGEEAVLTLHQAAKLSQEEEISFGPVEDILAIDGKEAVTCFLDGEEASFAVEASGAWKWACDSEFLTVTKTETGLRIQLETKADELRKACITLTCGMKNAYLYVYQLPEEKGAQVLSASVSQEAVTAYDAVQADVLCDGETDFLTVAAPGYQEVFPARDWAKETEEGLFFQVDVPLSGEGKQMILFAAENEDGSGKKQTAFVDVTAEGADFACDAGVFTAVGNRRDVQFTTTARTESIILLDAAGESLGRFTPADGAWAFAGEGWEKERFIQWTLPVAADAEPAFVLLEGMRLPVEKRTVLTPKDIQLYSQTDGWWQDKKYSVSQLEQSGCAVFSLSHALQLLGYTGEEIQPEKLAKTYAVALMKDGSGTMNSTLVGRAGDDFGFKTRYELYENPNTIRDKAAQGAVFTFSVVNGHIACVAEVTEDKCLIIDSAPSATFERKGNTPVYVQDADGLFVPVEKAADLPGVSYCIETDSYSCAVYYMDLSYVARRGVRLIQPK